MAYSSPGTGLQTMEISNSIGTSSYAGTLRISRELKPDQNQRVDAAARPSANGSTEIDSDELARRGTEVQASRVQKLNNLEGAPLRTQQALNSYQQTLLAAQQFEQGQLVGIDLFA